MSFIDSEWILAIANEFLATANGFWRQRMSFSDSEWILAIANEFLATANGF